MLSVNIPRDRTSGTTTRMVPHESDTDRDRRRSIVSRCASERTRQRKIERWAIYYVARGIGAINAPTPRFSSPFSLDRRRMNTANCLNYREARWQCKARAFCISETCTSLCRALLSYSSDLYHRKGQNHELAILLLIRLLRTILAVCETKRF